MSSVQKKSWEGVRRLGRDRFLLKSIGMYACGCAVACFLFEAVFLLIGRNFWRSVWDAVITWASLSLIMGVAFGLREWNQNERSYQNSESETQNSYDGSSVR
jgi:hypothetical protein